MSFRSSLSGRLLIGGRRQLAARKIVDAFPIHAGFAGCFCQRATTMGSEKVFHQRADDLSVAAQLP